jgi:hypothetical protein
MLFELLDTHSFAQFYIENSVVAHDVVTVLTNLDHRLDYLVPNEE